jgi:predicted GIY-YIG superfamily endonuclease
MTDTTPKFTKRQQVFIDEYLKCFNGAEAARRAGYSEKSARQTGSDLLANPDIKEYINVNMDERKNNTLSIASDWIRAASKKSNYVYLIRADNGLTKIGISYDVERRLYTLDTASPVRLSLLFFFEPSNAVKTEKYLHIKFDKKRVKGEWFNLSDSDIDWIRMNYDII